MATYTKHSKRTVRSGCPDCGNTDLYWGHDEDDWIDDYCSECESYGKLVLIDRHGNPHFLSCPGNGETATAEEIAEAIKATEGIPAAVVASAPVPAPTPVVGTPEVPTDALNALQVLMSALAPKVDRAEVASMIKAELDNVIFPTRVVVERASGERKEITGAHERLTDVVTALMAGLHVMMVGPAGTGKSTLAESAAESLELDFYAISLSPQTPASALLGYMNATGEYVRTAFRDAYENGGVFLFDEIDNGHPSTIAVMNAALANGYCAFPDGMIKKSADFKVVASANTYGRGADRQYVGRQAMDAATLDRFAVIDVNYDESLETELCKSTGLDGGEVQRVLTYVRQLRKSAADQNMRVIVSTRGAIGMCRLLHAGVKWHAAADMVILKGMSDQDRRKLGA